MWNKAFYPVSCIKHELFLPSANRESGFDFNFHYFISSAPKTPAAFAGQRVRLERARMGDLLKAKIQQRPARQELIRQHILEGW